MKRRPPSEKMDWQRPSESFLAYLERLAEASLARDREQVDKLLRMRLSSHLPRTVLDELEFFRRAKASGMRAPLKLMRYYHQMRQLSTAPAGQGAEQTQLGLELRERDLAAPVAAGPRRRNAARGRREAGGGTGKEGEGGTEGREG